MPVSEQGVSTDRYTLIPRTLIFLTRGESVLLLKGADDKRIWPGAYNGVGGHVERGEDVIAAARRELFEETGLNAETLWLCGIATIDTGQDPGIGLYIFKGTCPRGKPRKSPEGSLEWVHREELDSKPLVEDLPELLPLILERKPEDPPFAAQYRYDEDEQLQISFAPLKLPLPRTPRTREN